MAKKTEKPVEEEITPVDMGAPEGDKTIVSFEYQPEALLRNALTRFVNNPGWHTNIYGAQELTIALPADELEAFRRLVNG